MHYFIKNLLRGNRKFWLAMVGIGAWTVAVLDFATSFYPPGLCNGKCFTIILQLTILSALFYLWYYYAQARIKKKKMKTVEEEAAPLEAKREKDFREILKENPQFATNCYECIHFNRDLLHCSRKLAKKTAEKRLMEVTINDKQYCLYWEPAGG